MEIPTGLPLVYNFQQRCIQLLDDGRARENPVGQVSEYNFGSSPDLLFKPCEMEGEGEVLQQEADEAEECFLDGYASGSRSFRHDPIIRLSDSSM